MIVQFSALRGAIAPRQMTCVGLLSALALVPIPCQAQLTGQDSDQPHFLWQVESPTNTVYLLGSVHLLSETSYPLPAPMEAAFEEAEVLVLEADLGSGEAATAAAFALLEKAQPEPGESLAEVLSPETYALAEQATQAQGLPMELFRQTEPWFLAISLTASQLVNLGYTPESGIDQYFYQQATTAEKPILFLETIDEQADLFEQLSIDEQRQFVQQTLEEIDLVEDSYTEIVEAWTAGDADGMAELLLASFEDYPEMEAIFLSDRNQNWLPQIETYLQDDEDYLVVVGALHLVGPDSLINLLEQVGYEAEQL